MAIIVALRKILNSKAIMFSLLFGMLLSAALVALVPTYSSMSLNRTFVKELENFQEETGIYPGMVLVSGFYNENGILDVLRELELTKMPALSDERVRQYLDQRRRSVESTQRFVSDVSGRLGITPEVQIDNLISMAMVFNIETNRGINQNHGILQSLTGLDSYGSLLRGKYPEEPSNGVYEAMVTESSLQSFGIEVGDTISASPRLDENHISIRIKVVGTFDVNPEHPLAWNFFKPSMFKDSLLLRPEDADGLFMGAPSLVASMRSYQAYNYHRLLDIGINPLLSMKKDLSRNLYTHGANVDIPMIGRAAAMLQQESSLRSTMWMLNIPVLIMLLLYIVMLARMLVDNDTGEIAMLASRGGTQRFIFIIYFVLGMVLALTAYLSSLPLSLFLAKALSSVNGFLSFVYRRISQVNLGKESYLLAVLALTIAVLMLAVPAAFKQRSLSIQFRRLNGRDQRKPFWFRFGLDILMLSASIAG